MKEITGFLTIDRFPTDWIVRVEFMMPEMGLGLDFNTDADGKIDAHILALGLRQFAGQIEEKLR